MSWLAIIMAIIQYGPVIFKVVLEIIDIIKSRHPADHASLNAEMKMAINAYKSKKDQGPLRALLKRLKEERDNGRDST